MKLNLSTQQDMYSPARWPNKNLLFSLTTTNFYLLQIFYKMQQLQHSYINFQQSAS